MQIHTKFDIDSYVWLLINKVPNVGKVETLTVEVKESHFNSIEQSIFYVVKVFDRLAQEWKRHSINESHLYASEEDLFESIHTDLTLKFADL